MKDDPMPKQDAAYLLAMVKRYSEDGKRSVTIPNGDVPALLRCLEALTTREGRE